MTSNKVLSSNPYEDSNTKASFRFKVWNLLENKDLVRFPRPCKGRIPNFVDCALAAEKLATLDVFKKAENIMVNLDKPQEPVRFTVLEAGKTLLVPTPRPTDGLITKVCPPAETSKQALRMACWSRAITKLGNSIKLEEKIHIGMLVLGSVAVSKEGHRIGKGEGFKDLEFAVMAAVGSVTEDTVIVTTVHDEQGWIPGLGGMIGEDIPKFPRSPTDVKAAIGNPYEDSNTKAAFRFKVWNLLENKDLVRFPRPCKGRIPNFVDCALAAEKLATLDVFKKAENIKVNLDKPQEPVRFTVLEAGKTLLVPTPRPTDGLITKVCPPAETSKQELRMACSAISELGNSIKLEEKIHIDMLVLGSVAVSKEGHRIGKGEGFSDLKFAVMTAVGSVTEDTVIVTTVHDEQVFDTLPHNLFQPFDIPVDIIVTPTTVIEVKYRLPKPKGIIWNILSDRRMQLVPLLKTLRTKYMDEGQDCTLKEVDSEPENRPKPYYRPSFRPRSHFIGPRRGRSQESGNTSPSTRRTRFFHRGGQRKQGANEQRGETAVKSEWKMNRKNKEEQELRQKPMRKVQQRRFNKNKLPENFSVKVTWPVTIGSTVRVRDLKAALQEKGVRPKDITWKGARGFALLHFAKMKAQSEEQQPAPMAVDDVIASLQALTVTFKNKTEVKETLFSVEPAKPITRIKKGMKAQSEEQQPAPMEVDDVIASLQALTVKSQNKTEAMNENRIEVLGETAENEVMKEM